MSAEYVEFYKYVMLRRFKVATNIIPDVGNGDALLTFSAITASAPSGGLIPVSGTNKDQFLFMINGQYIEHDLITISQSGSYLNVYVSTGSLGYAIETDDEITGWGKFRD